MAQELLKIKKPAIQLHTSSKMMSLLMPLDFTKEALGGLQQIVKDVEIEAIVGRLSEGKIDMLRIWLKESHFIVDVPLNPPQDFQAQSYVIVYPFDVFSDADNAIESSVPLSGGNYVSQVEE